MPSFLHTQGRALREFQQRLFTSRFFTISLLLHMILVVTVGGTAYFTRDVEPADFSAEAGEGFVTTAEAPRPPQAQQPFQQQPTFTVAAPANAVVAPVLNAITTTAPAQTSFTLPAITAPAITAPVSVPIQPTGAAPIAITPTTVISLPPDVGRGIANFTSGWAQAGPGGAVGMPMRSRDFQFTVYLAKYGGDWGANVKVSRGGKITGGSLPNLFYFIGKISHDKIKADLEAVPLDLSTDEMFTKKPPFIFFCGHRDFKLTEKEVENLRKYITLGGCVWGDSSLPGARSRFDIAFRREMRRVLPDADKAFEALPQNHDLFSRNGAKVYFTDIASVPPGMNFYQEPVHAIRLYGEIAVLYTANDYGDMWQFGIDERGQIDERRDEKNNFVALDAAMWNRSGLYYRNISAPALFATYKFGTNTIVHLITRWEDKVRTVQRGM